MYFNYFFIALGVLAIIGFTVSHLLKISNPRIFDIQKTASSFSKETSWMKAFGAFFTAFYLLANLVLWAVFGIEQILIFVLFLILQLKNLVVWIWDNILNPTIVFAVKLAWHYPIGFLWKNTQLSFSNIVSAFNLNHIKSAIPQLVKFMLVTMVLYILHGLIDQNWFTVIAALTFFGFLIYMLITLGLIFANHDRMAESRKRLFTQFVILLALGGAVLGVLFTFMSYNNLYSISEIGFPISELLLPVGAIILFTLIISIPFGVGYHIQNSENGTSNYLKALFSRTPKFLYALPFFGLGLAIVSLVPILLYSGLDFGINSVTGADLEAHQDRIIAFSDIDNNYSHLSENIEFNEKMINNIDSLSKADSVNTEAFILDLESKKGALKSIGDNLLQKQIFYTSESYYQSETQQFSFPPVLNCEKYSWEIKDSEDKVVMSETTSAEIGNSSVISFKWPKSGKYSISVIPENICEKGEQYFANATILDFPSRSKQIDISGPNSLCAYDEATFSANGTFSQYEWVLPEGTSISEGSGTNKIKVIWGANSGVVSLRGNNKDEATSNYSSHEVKVIPGLDKVAKSDNNYPQNEEDFKLPEHAFAFYDIADVNDSISIIDLQIEEAKNKRALRAAEWKTQITALLASTESLESQQSDLIVQWFSTLFGMIGLIVLMLLSTPGLLYFFKFHFQLYSFHEEGEHYVSEEWKKLKSKDEKQPLFGWFLAVTITIVISMLFGGFKLSPNLIPINFSYSGNSNIIVEEEYDSESFVIEENEKFKIQIFTGTKKKANELISSLVREGQMCEILEKENGKIAVVLSETFPNSEMACENLFDFKNLYPEFEDAFLLNEINGHYQAFDSELCY